MRLSEDFQLLVFQRGAYVAFDPDCIEIWLHDGSPPADIDNDSYTNDFIAKLINGVSSTKVEPSIQTADDRSSDGSIVELQGQWSDDVLSANAGTATWFSIRRTAAQDAYLAGVVADGLVTAAGGGGELELPSAALVTNDTVTVESLYAQRTSAGIAINSSGTVA